MTTARMQKAGATPPPLVLDQRRIDAWRVDRHFLATPAKAGSIEAVAEALVGVQAQVASAAEQSICTRVAGTAPRDVRLALEKRRVVRTWAMRGTLHLVPAHLFPILAAALSTRTQWRRPVWLRAFKVTVDELDRLVTAIAAVLDDGRPRTRAELADEVAREVGEALGRRLRSSWGEFLKPAAFQGLLCQGPPRGGQTTFVRPERWLGTWRAEDPETALPDVLQRYLAAYGPATVQDVARWWGVPPADIRATVNGMAADGSIAEAEVDGLKAFLRAEDVDEIAATRPLRGQIRLLGPFDPLVVGAGLRDGFIPPAELPRVSRTAGWISPVLLVNGRVGGLWQSEVAKGRLVVRVEPFAPLDRAAQAKLEAETRRVGTLLAPDAAPLLEMGKVDYAPRQPQAPGRAGRAAATADVS